MPPASPSLVLAPTLHLGQITVRGRGAGHVVGPDPSWSGAGYGPGEGIILKDLVGRLKASSALAQLCSLSR